MKNSLLLLTLLSFALLTGCGDHFLSNSAYRNKVFRQFEKTRQLAKNRDKELFGVFDQNLNRQEEEALKFLYAYMSLGDLADYNGEFFLQNVRLSLAARDTFPWGRSVPEREFRHFVLPVRVNNENLDTSRGVFFNELKDRIKHLSMTDAVLEINHWCREKVTYKGTDERTSSPLSTVKTAFGRCGEESTFAVAAFRAAGIPARQCYTPRWAHCDDNHAWVEVWVDGNWHYLGACEPEPVLDRAWFTEPAKRAMLVNTNVFGDYDGPEDVLLKDERFTRINILSNYTKTKRVFVKVLGADGSPEDSASVEFQLYNYAEFYPLTSSYTDRNGLCSFLTGYGDLLAWAAKGNASAFSKLDVRTTDTLVLSLSAMIPNGQSMVFDLVPPAKEAVKDELSDSLKNANSKRVEMDDLTRAAYEKTFLDSAKTVRLAATLKLNPDTLWYFMSRSRGNSRELALFLTDLGESQRAMIFPLLDVLSEKDLRDIDFSVLADVLDNGMKFTPQTADRELLFRYILNPRIANEYLKPWRKYLQDKTEPGLAEKSRKDPLQLRDWIAANITVDSLANYGRAPLTPVGAFELRVADKSSRDLLFVALCRSFGIPARLETATKIPQYFGNGAWNDVGFGKRNETSGKRGILVLTHDPTSKPQPEYYIHYTIEKLEKGYYRSLDYEADPVMRNFPASVSVLPGDYLLVTGRRVGEGTVLAKLDFFALKAGEETKVPIVLRTDESGIKSYGKAVDPAAFLGSVTGSGNAPAVSNGAILALISTDAEPSRHFIADLIVKKREFDAAGVPVLLLFRDESDRSAFVKKNSGQLPATVTTAIWKQDAAKTIGRICGKPDAGSSLPLVLLLQPDGNIAYFSEGYRIGTGDDLLHLIEKK